MGEIATVANAVAMLVGWFVIAGLASYALMTAFGYYVVWWSKRADVFADLVRFRIKRAYEHRPQPPQPEDGE